MFSIDNGIRCMLLFIQVNDVQAKLVELQAKGWTLANIGRAIGQSPVTVESWKAGVRSPANLQPVLAALNKLAQKKRIPPKKLYAKGNQPQGVINE